MECGRKNAMNKHYERLLFILLVGVLLVGLASTGAMAGLTLTAETPQATANSIWNWVAVWQDDSGIKPRIADAGGAPGGGGKNSGTDGSAFEYGFDTKERSITIGSVRSAHYVDGTPAPTLAPDAWSDAVVWWPSAPEPDGFVGFAAPTGGDVLSDSKGNALETYEKFGYACIQPDPVSAANDKDSRPADETSSDVRFDHGLDFVRGTDPITIPDTPVAPAAIEVPDLNADGTAPEQVIPYCAAISADTGTGMGARPATPAVIVTHRVPLLLVGVWTSTGTPIKARIRNANDIYPASGDPTSRKPEGWPKYNVIEIMESGGKIPSEASALVVSYYTAGTHYVVTQRAPMPLPYTVYKIPVLDPSSRVVKFNDAITHFDPDRDNDPTKAETRNADPANFDPAIPQCGIMGIYTTTKLGANPDNPESSYFVLGDGKSAYKVDNGYGMATLNSTLPTGITDVYVQVSTNAVTGVWTVKDHGIADQNYYLGPQGSPTQYAPIGYCGHSAIIRLATPLPDPGLNKNGVPEGAECYVRYRRLSDQTFTVGETTSVGYVNNVEDLRPANTAWKFSPVSQVPMSNGQFGVGTALPYGTYAAGISYYSNGTVTGGDTSGLAGGPDSLGYFVYLVSSTGQHIPMHWDGKGSPETGMSFRVSVSSGLNMSNANQQPNANDRSLNLKNLNNKLIYDNYGYPVYYVNDLHPDAGIWPNPSVRKYSAYGKGTKSDGNVLLQEQKDVAVTAYDSAGMPGIIDYGGQGDLDWLTCYSDGHMPDSPDVDPLSVEPLEESNTAYPDDGSGSTQFVFRVRYHNTDSLPPKPWLHDSDDKWGWNCYSGQHISSGVVLYLDQNGTGNYKPHFMQPDKEDHGLGEDIYEYRVIPHNEWKSDNITGLWPHQESSATDDNMLYQSLAMGTYHYFFACSDDSLTFDDGSFPFEFQYSGNMNDDVTKPTGMEEWGAVGGAYSSTGLDPYAVRSVSGYTDVDRPLGRRYTSDQIRQLDGFLYVDRPTRAPGVQAFESRFMYPYNCNNYPKVTCELNMSPKDKFNKRYDDSSYGYGRFFGTLSPYRDAVNPAHAGARGTGDAAMLAETSGSYSKDTDIFRIFYRQVSGLAPLSIKLWVNDASEKTGTDTAHQYRSYTMKLSSGQSNPDYKAGVWFEKQLQCGTTDLPKGPHTYYFTADDGIHSVRWPVRPDTYVYDGKSYVDLWVPTSSEFYDHKNADYVDNDYVPGPYVNNAPVISNVSVTPGTGKEGTSFEYRATYTDPDGQMPFSAVLHIEVNDTGSIQDVAMKPDPKYNIDPNADNSALYKAGVDYIFDTGTANGLLQKGARRFYIEFTDNWGRQDNSNQYIQGETTRYPAGSGNWVSGPVISGNTAPTLSNGRVESLDTTANAATMWTFRVNYRDVDNDAPQVKLYIGELQPPDTTVANPTSAVRTILWDSGHTMLQSDPTDTSYTDGAELYYQTRLGGPDTPTARQVAGVQIDSMTVAADSSVLSDIGSVSGVFVGTDTTTNYYSGTTQAFASGDTVIHLGKALPDPLPGAISITYTPVAAKQYYYAFEGFDGTDYASYKSASKDTERSNAAGCFLMQDVTLISGKSYKVQPVIAKSVTLASATDTFDLDPKTMGDIVRVLGVYNNEDLTGTNYYSQTIANKTVKLSASLSGTVWVAVEGNTPIIGPLQSDETGQSGPMTDIRVYQNASSNGDPEQITDQKNGYISEDGTDRAVLTMSGIAEHVGNASSTYVIPDDSASIASIEGVYWLDNPDSSHRYDNYYEPDHGHIYSGSYDTPTVAPPVVRLGTVLSNADSNTYATVADPEEIDAVLGVYDNPSLTGQNYLAGVGDPVNGATDKYVWQEAYVMLSSTVWPRQPMDIAQIKGVYLGMDATGDNYYDPLLAATPYAPESSESLILTKNLSDNLPIKVYIAYYPIAPMANMPGTTVGGVMLKSFPDLTKPAYLKVWTKGFNAGDDSVRLTTPLPDLVIPATASSAAVVVSPADVTKLSDMASVTGVYVDGDATNYYTNTANPFQIGDTVVRLALPLPNISGKSVTIHYVPKVRRVTVKYSDIRFTHVNTGEGMEVEDWRLVDSQGNSKSIWLTSGSAFFVSDGVLRDDTGLVTNLSTEAITGNSDVAGTHRDVDGGVIGVWTYDTASPNYLNPRRINTYDDNPWYIRLSTELPAGTRQIYARAYQKGDYFIDRWNRVLRFEDAHDVGATDRVQVSYFFGTKMPYTLLPNTMPTLSEGKVTPITGTRNTQYVYTVKYTDVDGPNGQMPSYVRVYIDGVPYDMTAVSQGTPVYRTGAVYSFTPTGGLSGGSRRFHFEASDGAAIAWFDKNGAHQAEKSVGSANVVDIDGPWVNDPPVLSSGTVNPNPQTGGVATTEAITYTVNLKDLDNDPPFTSSDPVYLKYTGSPRVWIDASVDDDSATPMVGTIVGLEVDPLVPTKKRVIVAKVEDSKGDLVDPGWTTDQFAGKLMQISTGIELDGTGSIVRRENVDDWSDISPNPGRRVYLIQSNTSNKLTIATDTLVGEKLDPSSPQPTPELPADPKTGYKRYAQFRVNGLLMTAADSSKYSDGVQFAVTIPGLPVGTHKYHFTARTAETKPDWLLPYLSDADNVPYSDVVRFPVSVNDLTGPTVISTTPANNVAPVLSKTGGSTLFRGPKAQVATVQTPTTARPSNYIPIQTILGVYENANFDAHLDDSLQKNFFDSTLGHNPPGTGESVYMTTLAKTPDTVDLVQLSSSVVDLLTVTPEVPSAIGSVTAVYSTSDPTLATPYAPASASLVNGQIKLAAALPAGTSQVYIKYKPATAIMAAKLVTGSKTVTLSNPETIGYVVGVFHASDTTMDPADNLCDITNWTPGSATIGWSGEPMGTDQDLKVVYVPWPPVYLKYFAVEPTDASPYHGIFTAGEPLTFKIVYKDLNSDGTSDPPTFHDGVQGYVKIVFNDTGRTSQLVPQSTSTDYANGVPFGVTLTDVPEGLHPYHFEASDGYVVTRFPADATGSGSNDERVRVNYKPALSNPAVDHTSGATAFKYTVTYSDKDNGAPTFVRVVLTNHADASKTYKVDMSAPSGTTSWSSGVLFTGSTGVDSQGNSVLPSGTYDSVFYANDGTQDADPLKGPQINVRDTNAAPTIADYTVGKLLSNGQLGTSAGKISDTYVYQARYKDVDNDPPVYVGSSDPALTLIVDDGTAAEQRFMMTMVPLTASNSSLKTTPAYDGNEYTDPVDPNNPTATRYQHIWPVFQVKVAGKKLGPGDHTYTVAATDGSLEATVDPVRKSGPTLMVPYFKLKIVSKDGEPITDRSIVGSEVLIQGKMYFPYTTSDQVPSSISNITIQVTKPDSTTLSLNASLTNVVANDPTNPTNWQGDITVTYNGNLDPSLVTGQSLTLTASGMWTFGATWPGDSSYDGATTDTNWDGQNDQVRITVAGPCRTIAVTDPLNPATSTPIADMITPPMLIGATSPGAIFGYDRAIPLRVVKWVPSSSQYFWYDVGGVFPALQPGDAVWVKPNIGTSSATGSGYPAAESLGFTYTLGVAPTSSTLVPMNGTYASHINGVYLNSSKTGTNYYVHASASVPFKAGADQIVLTSALPSNTTLVYVDYVGSQSSVDEGWTALDNPAVQRVVVDGDPRYIHSQYRLIKVAAQAYSVQTAASGSTIVDDDTKLPLLKPCTISLTTGWNQFGNIFFNWKKTWQAGTPAADTGVPGVASAKSSKVMDIDQWNVVPVDTSSIGKVLGVYLNQQLTGTNYYQPGISTQPYKLGDSSIHLTTSIPASTTKVYIKYEQYPREDIGIPLSEVHVTHLGERKTLAQAKAAGWVTDYAWRYDATQHNYTMVSPTASGAERVLKAWSGYWIRCYVDCQLEIDPNTTYNGESTVSAASVGTRSGESLEMPPPAPN